MKLIPPSNSAYSNFTLKKQLRIFGPNLPKKDISGQKQKKWTSLLNCAHSN